MFKKINEISLEKKIGQMLMVGFKGKKPMEPQIKSLSQHIAEGEVGGVLFFTHNIDSFSQTKALTTHFQQAAPQRVPLFIAVDQEGGKVQRLNASQGFTDYRTPQHVALDLDPSEAESYYRDLAQEVQACGFTLNFAPCVDLNGPCPVIGGLERAYHEDPEHVMAYARAFIQAHRTRGVLTSLKHFPGHGLAKGDTHKGAVDITETFEERELRPFYGLIDQDLVDTIMIAHVTHQGFDPHHPATLSQKYITPLLRQKGFDGVCVSDDLHMGALLQQYEVEDIVVRAINAGIDLLVFSGNPLAAVGYEEKMNALTIEGLHALILKALEEDRIPESRIHESYERIMKLKMKVSVS